MRYLAVALFAAFLASSAGAATDVTFRDIEESLTCQCGCGLTVAACNHVQCPSAIPLRQEIREQLALHLGKLEILKHFSEKYGEKILSAPTTTGFNLTAWVTPFIGVAFGAGIVVFTLLRWRRVGPAELAAPSAPASAADAARNTAYEKILQKELDDFDA